ncbi:hypothetical protein C5167_004567 [Papaver somniferum]|uniref:Cytochrome P450 n=1 Tax=Papaver somniferum TaxID=3469 RepID=A0A4Y7JBH5_PAPSO|nr:cytochrome P450 87A3-like [Papaver somniferum]RZC57261.1 hypothetical protein C5167_004567 [Papaver somniferum]
MISMLNTWSIVPFVISLVTISFIHYVYRWRNPECNGEKLPPGSMGLPLIGETIQFFIPNNSLDMPMFFKKRLARYGSVFKTSLVFHKVVVSLDPDFNHFIFQQERKTVQLWYMDSFWDIFGKSIESSADLTILKYFRNCLLNQFGTETIKEKLLPKIEVTANRYLRSWSTQSSFEVKASITRMVFDLTAKHLFNYDPMDMNVGNVFADFFDSIMTVPINVPGTTYHKCMKNKKKAIQLMKDILRERRNSTEKKGDFLDQIIEDMKTMEFLTEDFVVYFIFGMFLASFSTISTNLTLAFELLTDHPAVVNQLLEEQDNLAKSTKNPDSPLTWDKYKSKTFMSQVVDETLRMSNIFPGILKKVIKDIHVNGYTIPEGWTIMLVPSAVHMSPEKFPDPRIFNPWRWNNIGGRNAPSRDYIPFGGGLRHCVGAEFSKAVMAIFMRVLITKFSWTKLKGGHAYRNPALSFGSGFHVKISEKDQIKN